MIKFWIPNPPNDLIMLQWFIDKDISGQLQLYKTIPAMATEVMAADGGLVLMQDPDKYSEFGVMCACNIHTKFGVICTCHKFTEFGFMWTCNIYSEFGVMCTCKMYIESTVKYVQSHPIITLVMCTHVTYVVSVELHVQHKGNI